MCFLVQSTPCYFSRENGYNPKLDNLVLEQFVSLSPWGDLIIKTVKPFLKQLRVSSSLRATPPTLKTWSAAREAVEYLKKKSLFGEKCCYFFQVYSFCLKSDIQIPGHFKISAVPAFSSVQKFQVILKLETCSKSKCSWNASSGRLKLQRSEIGYNLEVEVCL